MAVTVEFRFLGETFLATVRDGEWSCDNPNILEQLGWAKEAWTSGGLVYDYDRQLAEHAVDQMKFYKGVIVHADPSENRGEEGAFWSDQNPEAAEHLRFEAQVDNQTPKT